MIVTEATQKLGENISVLKEVVEIPLDRVNFQIKLANTWIVSQKISSDHLNLAINRQHSFLFRYFSDSKVTLAYPVKYNQEIVRGFDSLDNLIHSIDLKIQKIILELRIEQIVNNHTIMTNTPDTVVQKKSFWLKMIDFIDRLDKKINKTDLQNIDLSGTDFMGQNFDNVNFSHSIFKKTDLSVASFRNCNLSYADLTGSDLSYADLTNADLTNANLTGANLTNANLTNANLTNVILVDANLIKINLTNAKLSDVIQQKINKTTVNNYVTKKYYYTAQQK